MRALAILATALLLPALAHAAPHPPPTTTAAFVPPSGTLSICNTSGARPITGSLSFTLAAAASAGGTQTITVAVGACAQQIFYPQGATVTVSENVPSGYAVTSIAIAGGGSTLASTTPASGSAAVLIGAGQAVLTFVTSGPPPAAAAPTCRVPNLLGLGLPAAKTALGRAHCTLGRLRRAYSNGFRAGHVMAEAPRRGALLAPRAPVDLVLSRGPKP